jgi:hypothetical protein
MNGTDKEMASRLVQESKMNFRGRVRINVMNRYLDNVALDSSSLDGKIDSLDTPYLLADYLHRQSVN